MSDGRAYLRPAGLLWGSDAAEVVTAGDGGFLAGGPVAFTRIEMLLRQESTVSRSWHGFADLRGSRDRDIREGLEMIMAPRRLPFGLDGERTHVMGIVNVTPDSFSDGGETPDAESAIARGLGQIASGAAIIDIGGESTRPGSDPTPEAEELARVVPVIAALAGGGHAISCDTRRPAVMRAAVAAGARLVNDVTALGHDPGSIATVRDLGVPAVLMHARGEPRTMQHSPAYDDVALDVFDALEARIAACDREGIDAAQLIADPGIGFGKTFIHNLELLARMTLFHALGVPLLVGASRKAFIGAITGERPVGRRVAGSLASALHLAMQGVQIVRVHDVAETAAALKVFRAAAHTQRVTS
jgi:dihydropteroate synthase